MPTLKHLYSEEEITQERADTLVRLNYAYYDETLKKYRPTQMILNLAAAEDKKRKRSA